ncbi:hypothetical protein [Salinarimonas ramus]|uniref:Uncharacterized protein n=1 Tax=Salinarimonas ramus TaxID=690164 RepID=A0A917Q9N7_9HYPH|nr:hypothetical protein [Salinarimonas ramus]GGK38512.1 hypothetical protein GCM10011322_26930 [Salinarimonas ramus]
MSKRTIVAALVYLPINAVLFGIGAVTVLAVPALDAQAATLIPWVVVASFVLGVPIAWALAPRLQARAFRKQRREAGIRDDETRRGRTDGRPHTSS